MQRLTELAEELWAVVEEQTEEWDAEPMVALTEPTLEILASCRAGRLELVQPETERLEARIEAAETAGLLTEAQALALVHRLTLLRGYTEIGWRARTGRRRREQPVPDRLEQDRQLAALLG